MQASQDFSTIIKEGFLEKQSKFLKEYRKRWIVLTPVGVYSFKTQGDLKNPTEFIPLKDCNTIKSAEEEIHKENAFRLDCQSNRIFYFIAPSPSDKESWIGAIGKTMVKLNSKSRKQDDDDDD